MSDFELVKLDEQQWKRLDLLLNGIDGALNKLGDYALKNQTAEITKWLAIQNETIATGFAALVKAITETSLPEQRNPLEVKFVFKVADDHQDEPFSISIGGVTDAEGQPIPDPSGLNVDVTSSDDSVVAVTFDPSTKSGNVSFGAPGVASLTASVTNAKGDILGSGAADFTVTTGDPAAVSDVKIAFSGLSEEPTT